MIELLSTSEFLSVSVSHDFFLIKWCSDSKDRMSPRRASQKRVAKDS